MRKLHFIHDLIIWNDCQRICDVCIFNHTSRVMGSVSRDNGHKCSRTTRKKHTCLQTYAKPCNIR